MQFSQLRSSLCIHSMRLAGWPSFNLELYNGHVNLNPHFPGVVSLELSRPLPLPRDWRKEPGKKTTTLQLLNGQLLNGHMSQYHFLILPTTVKISHCILPPWLPFGAITQPPRRAGVFVASVSFCHFFRVQHSSDEAS